MRGVGSTSLGFVGVASRYDNWTAMEEELENQTDCLRLEGACRDPLWFPSPEHCLKHLLDHGFHYAGGCLKPEGPLACEVEAGINLLPEVETLCAATEGKYFVNESIQSAGRKSSSHLRLHTSSEEQDLSEHLLYACARGLPTALQLVLSSGRAPDLNTPLPGAIEWGLSPLAVASLGHAPPCCELLISHGAGVNWTDRLGRSALHWAVLGSNLRSVRLLLKYGAATSLTDSQGFTPLLYASIMGAAEIVSVLLKERCAVVDEQHGRTGVTALMSACVRGEDTTARVLLKHRADVTLCDKHGLSPLHCAVWGGSLKCVKQLVAHGNRALLTLRDQWGRSALLTAAAKGDPTLLQYLVKKGARWSDVDQCRRTALHWAILSQQASCVDFILDKRSRGGGALCSQPDSSGATPAHYAAMIGREDLLSVLQNKGASMSVTDHSGFGPLLWATAFGKAGVVKMLLGYVDYRGIPSNRNEAEVPETLSEMLHPLHAAAGVGAEEVCLALLDAGAEVGVANLAGLSPLHLACQFGHCGCVRVLLAAGAPVDFLTPQQESALHLACTHGSAPVVRELLVNGAQRDRQLGPLGHRPLHLASLRGHTDVLEVLLNNGCAVDEPRPLDLRSPLHLASAQGHLSCCQLLVMRGASTALRDSSVEGFTALDLAMLNVHASCAAYLVSVHAPTGGGKYHRAALTIQTAWRFHRHKRRWGHARRWAAVVIQRAVRFWLARSRACRVRRARERARNRAATLIQHHWRLYIRQKRRYESTYARLRAKLEQERLATSLILSELHGQTQSIRLPPTVRTNPLLLPSSPAPRYLLKASSNPPLPLFPSGSLLFPSHPHKPLARKPPIIRIAGSEKRSPTPTPVNPVSPPTVHGTDGEQLNVTSDRRSRFPPIPTSHSLTAPQNNVTPISVGITRGFPKSMQQKQPLVSKAIQSPKNSSEKFSESVQKSRVSRLPPVNSAAAPLPFVSADDIDPLTKTRPTTSEPLKLPPLPRHTVSQAQNVNGCTGQHPPHEGGELSSCPHASPARVPAQSYITRQSMFKEAPLGYKPTHTRQQGAGTDEDDGGAVEQQVLHQAQRYTKLNEVLSLLQQAREAQQLTGGERDGARASELKQHIKTALDEAIRLRADTEALQTRVQTSVGNQVANTVNS